MIKILTARIGYYDRGFVVVWPGGHLLPVERGFAFPQPVDLHARLTHFSKYLR